MGKWDRKLDFKMILTPYSVLLIILAYALFSGRFYSVDYVGVEEPEMIIGEKLHFYLHYVSSFVIVFLTASMFEETHKKESTGYIRTLPMGIHQIWTFRYLRLLCLILISTLPFLLIGIEQIKIGINEYMVDYQLYSLDKAPVILDRMPVSEISLVMEHIVAVNFYLLITQSVLMLTRSKAATCIILFAYFVFELGPWGHFLDSKAIFCGSIYSTHLESVHSNFYIMLIISLILQFVLYKWHQLRFFTK